MFRVRRGSDHLRAPVTGFGNERAGGRKKKGAENAEKEQKRLPKCGIKEPSAVTRDNKSVSRKDGR